MRPETEKFLDDVFVQHYKILTTDPHEPFGRIQFSGWKEIPNSLEARQYIAWYPPRSSESSTCYVVPLPGVIPQKFEAGGTFEIGDYDRSQAVLRYDMGPKQKSEQRERLRAMFKDAIIKLVDFVFEDNPEWLGKGLNSIQREVEIDM